MNSKDLRAKFLEYFASLQHTIVSSSSLVPANDPTLLFTNAGMVQFKDTFLGKESRSYFRAASTQRCVRAGGKHNDLENVGYTARHHTFFEMLGNFSFGDYFKREAIKFAWDFLTQVLKLPTERLWITVYEHDDEAADIWLNEMKVDPTRFSRCGEKDNFWAMGDTGPCGPCSEIFYDHGPEIPGGPPGCPEADGDRYIEIWNLVFMQYNRSADGTLTPLPKPSVDTGMGLERIAAVMQGVHSNYEIDIFRHLTQAIMSLADFKDSSHASLRVIADHIRSSAFLIADGVRPSNEGRGYVLRRIIRRAIRHGHKLGLRDIFFYKLIEPLNKEMGEAYPELSQSQTIIQKVLKHEEEQFANTLDQGLKILEAELRHLQKNIIPGKLIFRLYDTYGFPPDLTGDIARERNLQLDYEGFEAEMAKQREQSQTHNRFSIDYNSQAQIEGETEFIGYESMSGEAKVNAILLEGKLVNEISPKSEAILVLDRTPFYAESGGQVGDKGKIYFKQGEFEVTDTQKQGLVYLHYGRLISGKLQVGASVSAEVDSTRRAIMLNHSATHLLHSALRRILGQHVIQKGSLVEAERLRFDFSHFEPMTAEQIKAVEHLVNQQIRANLTCHVDFMSADQAKGKGAMALFDEKYGDEVRVLSMGEFSIELCGGTHVSRTGDIGIFKIISETGVAAGIRRIEAVTGAGAEDVINAMEEDLQTAASLLKTNSQELMVKLKQLIMRSREQEKIIDELRLRIAQTQTTGIAERVMMVEDVHVLATKMENVDVNTLRNTIDQLKQKWQKAIILLATISEGKIHLVAGVTKNCTERAHAGELVAYVAQQLGGKGGGRPDLAQGGGVLLHELDKALISAHDWAQQRLLHSTPQV